MKCKAYDRRTSSGAVRSKPLLLGYSIDLADNGDLTVMDDNGANALAVFYRARVLTISTDGLMIECFERRGANQMICHEVWCFTGTP